uniref:Nucleoporin NDC1 n=1 Tax=Anthurium amnicola TaxID=1678845 RepID=A0A1D1ZII5_9ARAE
MHPPSPAGPDIVKNRWLGFLIWQSITATSIYLLVSPLLGSPMLSFPSLSSSLSFLAFHLALLLFSLSLFLTSAPHPEPSASLPELAAGLLRLLLKSAVGGFQGPSFEPDLRRRAGRTMRCLALVVLCGVSGFLSVVALCGDLEALDGWGLLDAGLRGLVLGLVYGSYCVYKKRWVLQFPIIQRPLFFSFKMGLCSSLKQAIKLSISALTCSLLLMIFLLDHLKSSERPGRFIFQEIRLLFGASAVSFCWELSRHLLEVVHTRRCSFAPALGSAAAETNPNEILLEALEKSSPRSLFQYLAYLDLCVVSESNVELWLRAAFFEETGETYRRVISVCLGPLEQFTLRLAEALEGLYPDKSNLLSLQLRSPSDAPRDQGLHEAFSDFQLCTWCIRTAAALTACSHQEDRFGVAQLTGSNAAVVSTLLSCLLGVELCMGKKPNLQSAHQMGPASIKWATVQTGSRDAVTTVSSKRRSGALYAKAYAMADVLRTSIYQIVSVFEPDMLANAKASVLEKNWITGSKPLYGTREMLIQKLGLFLEYRAS